MSSSAEFESVFSLPIAALEYRDMAGHLVPDSAGPARKPRPTLREAGAGRRSTLRKAELAERISPREGRGHASGGTEAAPGV